MGYAVSMHLLSGPVQLLEQDERLAVLRQADAMDPSEVHYRAGKPLARSPLSFVIPATVQPAGAKDLLLVPEGDRTRGVLMVWQPIHAGDMVLQTGDLILREGLVYQTQAADNWGSFVQARIVQQDVGHDLVPLFAALPDPAEANCA